MARPSPYVLIERPADLRALLLSLQSHGLPYSTHYYHGNVLHEVIAHPEPFVGVWYAAGSGSQTIWSIEMTPESFIHSQPPSRRAKLIPVNSVRHYVSYLIETRRLRDAERAAAQAADAHPF